MMVEPAPAHFPLDEEDVKSADIGLGGHLDTVVRGAEKVQRQGGNRGAAAALVDVRLGADSLCLQ
jgi:hypothetical protein